MKTHAKKVGFMHLPGINDKAWEKHVAEIVSNTLPTVTIDKGNSDITFTVPGWIEKDIAKEVQRKLGYNLLGYSFHSYSKIQTSGGYRSTTWKCWRSCD